MFKPQQSVPAFESFPEALRVLIFGASGGLGAAFVRTLASHPRVVEVFAAARTYPETHLFPDSCITWLKFDLVDELSIERAVQRATASGPLHMVIVATGMLHSGTQLQPEKSWGALDASALAQAFAINVTGPALIAKYTLGVLDRQGKSVFAALSARVGSIEDNRLGGWHAYRASKAALHMLIRTCAIELRQRNLHALCVALHPGTVDTALSKPFQSSIAEGQLLTPAYSVMAMLGVLDRLQSADSGRAWAWDGKPLPF